jgi:hypothetical protein
VNRHTATLLSWSLVGVSMAIGLGGTGVVVAVEGFDGWHFVATDVLAIAIFFTAAVVGALVTSRLPSNPIGWIYLLLAVALGISGGADGYVVWAVDRGQVDGLVAWAAVYASDVFLAFFAALVLVLLLFPDGRLVTQRWRIVLWAAVAGLALIALAVFTDPGPLSDYPQVRNPLGVDSSAVAWLTAPAYLGFVGALIASIVSLVLRFRRSHGVERQQLKLLLVAGVIAVTGFVASPFAQASAGTEDAGIATTLVGILAIPVATGVAMLRYRLYEIDRVISRTIVYAALTVILGAAYVGLVLAGQALFSSFAGGSNLAIAGSTLVVAALFLPLRARMQRVVDRRFYRRRYDAQRTLEAFGARLREQVELDGLRTDLEHVVGETMQPVHASLWLRSER